MAYLLSRALSGGSHPAIGSQDGSQTAAGTPQDERKGSLTWARSEGLEPPAF
jgi:hypothetical protein